MKKKTVLGLVLLVVFTFVLFMNFGEQVGGYMNFAEAEASGAKAHVVGKWVEDQPMQYNPQTNVFSFTMQDDAGNIRQVQYANPKPANFEDAEQLVIEGHPGTGHFVAENILVKCPSKYNDGRGLEATTVSDS
jgi:cytochrome c-type biogenesis protein CcmE